MTIENFKDKIYALANNDSIELKEIENLIVDFYKEKPPFISPLKPDFIIRCSKNEPDEIFDKISRCSYNPNIQNIKLQRCNYPQQAVFYAAFPSDSDYINHAGSAIMEVMLDSIRQNDPSKVYSTISRWKISRPLNLFVCPFGQNVTEKNRFLEFASSKFESFINVYFDEKYSEAKKYFIDSIKFMSERLSDIEKKEINYRITSAFYNGIKRVGDIFKIKIDGMIYPSANTLSAGTNIVLNIELIDNKTVFCDYVAMYVMQRDPKNYSNVSFSPVSNSAVPDKDGNFTLTFTK